MHVTANPTCWPSAILPMGDGHRMLPIRTVRGLNIPFKHLKAAVNSTELADRSGPADQQEVGVGSFENQMFHTMQSSLNFKYPRARKLLLVVWSMKSLRSSSQLSLPVDQVHNRYCQDVTSRRVPEADFVEELLKGLALLSINPKQKQSGDSAMLKGITWAHDGTRPHLDSLSTKHVDTVDLSASDTAQSAQDAPIASTKREGSRKDARQATGSGAHVRHNAVKQKAKPLKWVSKPARRRKEKEGNTTSFTSQRRQQRVTTAVQKKT